ncbi:unnamed protein product [Cercospora beticola]|nr:unnamed protein product [Cercospora beticola]
MSSLPPHLRDRALRQPVCLPNQQQDAERTNSSSSSTSFSEEQSPHDWDYFHDASDEDEVPAPCSSRKSFYISTHQRSRIWASNLSSSSCSTMEAEAEESTRRTAAAKLLKLMKPFSQLRKGSSAAHSSA